MLPLRNFKELYSDNIWDKCKDGLSEIIYSLFCVCVYVCVCLCVTVAQCVCDGSSHLLSTLNSRCFSKFSII